MGEEKGGAMDERRTTLASEVAAELELTLPAAAQVLAEKLRLSQTVRERLTALRLVRRLASPDSDAAALDICGVATSASSLPAFGGLLYGTAVHAHRLRMAQRTILDAREQVRVELGDLDFYESGQRLRWKQTQRLFELLDELLAGEQLARTILLDHSIYIARGQEGGREMLEEVQEEWLEMVDAVNGFWKRHRSHLFPLAPEGSTIASVSSQNAAPLFVALHNNPETSVDKVAPELPEFIHAAWSQLRRAGMGRLLDALLPPRARTIAYSLEDLNLDSRWQPTELHHSGILGFFMRAGPQTPIWHVQVAGHRTQWTSEQLDTLATAICDATLGTGSKAEPLPLWYARRLAAFPHAMLEVFRNLAQERMTDAATPLP